MKNFEIEKYHTSVKTEVLAGITTFLACAYIIIVNPAILSQAGFSFSAVLTATVLVSFISTLAMGLYANNPILLAPGMGLNAFVAFSLVLGMKMPIATALGAVFWSGIFFILLSVFNIREKIVEAIPESIQKAVACGIGLFIALIGLKNGGMVAASQVTFVTMGKFTPELIVFVFGLAVTIYFVLRNVAGALLLGIVLTTLAAVSIGRAWGDQTIVFYKGWIAAPDFSLLFSLDFVGALKFAFIPAIFSLVFTDLFDSLSTFVGVSHAGNLLDERGKPLRIKKSLIVDAFATTISGLFGTSAATSYIESASGIQQGGRTGLTAVVAAVLFLPFLFFSPLMTMVPSVATAPALVLVGVFMMKPVLKIKWDQLDEAIPAFLAMVLIPLTFSISNGIIWGFLSWTLCKLVVGKGREISPFLFVIDLFCIGMLFVSSH